MPQPACLQSPGWTREEMNALERCYRPNPDWQAIAAHISTIAGIPRTHNACRTKARRLTLSVGQSKGRQQCAPHVHEDIEDMVILGYSTYRMARELGVSQSTVCRHIAKLSPSMRGAWKYKAKRRHAEGVSKSWEKRRRKFA